MKPIEQYKDAVMRRAEEKRIARKRAVRRTLAVCLPLCFCLGIIGATALPRVLQIGEDRLPEMNNGMCIETSDAAVICGNSTIAIDDAEAVYDAILALYDTDGNFTGNSYGSVDDLTDGADEESFSEDLRENGSLNGNAPYYLYFTRPEGTHAFLLQGSMLTDLDSGERVIVTEDQAQALINGEAPK